MVAKECRITGAPSAAVARQLHILYHYTSQLDHYFLVKCRSGGHDRRRPPSEITARLRCAPDLRAARCVRVVGITNLEHHRRGKPFHRPSSSARPAPGTTPTHRDDPFGQACTHEPVGNRTYPCAKTLYRRTSRRAPRPAGRRCSATSSSSDNRYAMESPAPDRLSWRAQQRAPRQGRRAHRQYHQLPVHAWPSAKSPPYQLAKSTILVITEAPVAAEGKSFSPAEAAGDVRPTRLNSYADEMPCCHSRHPE